MNLLRTFVTLTNDEAYICLRFASLMKSKSLSLPRTTTYFKKTWVFLGKYLVFRLNAS